MLEMVLHLTALYRQSTPLSTYPRLDDAYNEGIKQI
jgi:hypothetical protein